MTGCVPTTEAALFNESIHSVGFLCLDVCTPNCPCCQCSAGSLSYQPHEGRTGSFVIFFRLQTLCRNRKDSALFQVSQQGDAVIYRAQSRLLVPSSIKKINLTDNLLV